MFHGSTQKDHWIFISPDEIQEQRKGVNKKFCETHIARCTKKEPYSYFLRESEERILLRYFEHLLRDFCRKLRPPMPVPVIGTSCTYFKRFYMNNSVMDYHPKHIMLTCVYLACKIEEFNISISQFCDNIPKDKEAAAENILNHELLVLKELNFQLTVHNPYRPLEGFLIDIKTRYQSLKEPEKLRRGAEEFLHRSMASDAVLLFTPSQIALAAILNSASKQKMNIDKYVTEALLGGEKSNRLKDIISTIKITIGQSSEWAADTLLEEGAPGRDMSVLVNTFSCKAASEIKQLVTHAPAVNFEEIKKLERKLEICLNEENDPDSEIYRRRLQEQLDAEDDDGMTSHPQTHDEEVTMT